jgi:glutaminyl-tRNA synthetase
MAVLKPLKVILSNRPQINKFSVPDFPFDPSKGSHDVIIEDIIFIDCQDFRCEDSPNYFGLAPGKIVGLKYAFVIRCDKYDCDSNGTQFEINGTSSIINFYHVLFLGNPIVLYCTALPDTEEKPKSSIQWVAESSSVTVEVQSFAINEHPLLVCSVL